MVLRCGSSPAASPRVAKRSVPPRWSWLVPAVAWLTSPHATAPARVPPVVARKARRERSGATGSPGTCTISASPLLRARNTRTPLLGQWKREHKVSIKIYVIEHEVVRIVYPLFCYHTLPANALAAGGGQRTVARCRFTGRGGDLLI